MNVEILVSLDNADTVANLLIQTVQGVFLHELIHLVLGNINDNRAEAARNGALQLETLRPASLVLCHVDCPTNFSNHFLFQLNLAPLPSYIPILFMRNQCILIIIVHCEVPVSIELLVRSTTMHAHVRVTLT